MDAEKRTQITITKTRELFMSMLADPGALVEMTVNDIDPEEVEEKVGEILAYLDKTEPEGED